MTQPAKAQEPSMEEILASIRRIIADDEAKPEAAAPPPAATPPPRAAAPEPAAKAPPPRPAPPPKPVEAKPPAAKAAEPKPVAAPPPPPPPAAKNSQDEIDAMLAGLDAETTVQEVRPAPAPAVEDDVFELTEQMAVAAPNTDPKTDPKAFQSIEPQNDIEFAEPPQEPPRRAEAARPAPRAFFEQRVQERVIEEVAPAITRPLMSQSTVSAVDSAFNALAQTVLSNNARTLEDLVKEMLRPMLKAWLDDNLPNLVEKIVRAEIERVSRGR
jgi:cell pole-organizing protein PopZ